MSRKSGCHESGEHILPAWMIILLTFIACMIILSLLYWAGVIHWPSGPGANPPTIG